MSLSHAAFAAVCSLALGVPVPCCGGEAAGPPARDPQTGLVIDENWELVRANCGGCHSVGLVTQNHMSAANWVHTIRWMQEKHNLWELGENEPRIVAYLEKHYGVADLPLRRRPLDQPPLPPEEQTK